MVLLKSDKEIETLKEGGKRHKEILDILSDEIRTGVSSNYLNDRAIELINKLDGQPAFLNYKPKGSIRPYPAALCVSINNEIVHGIPNEQLKIISEGDVVSIDLGFKYKGLITDSAITVGVGKISKEAENLINVTKKSLYEGIKQIKEGNTIGDIGYAIESFVRAHSNFSLAEGLAGHGVGYCVHEEPFVPNYGEKGKGMKLKKGMVLAIEPMVNIGSGDIILDKKDGFTYKTLDGSLSAHFEHTIAICEKETVILTKLS